MAKKCIIKANEFGKEYPVVKNYDNLTNIELAIQRNEGYPMNQTNKGEPSLLYEFFQKELDISDKDADFVMANMFSDEFGDWFGKWWEEGNENVSQVRDINGQPKPVWSGQLAGNFKGVYEGYANTYMKDGQKRFGRSGYFLEDKYDALSYATALSIRDEKSFKMYQRFLPQGYYHQPVFLNIRNLENVEDVAYETLIPIIENSNGNTDGFKGKTISAFGLSVDSYVVSNDYQVITINGEEEDIKLGEDNINFQNDNQGEINEIPQEILKEITDVLTQKGLVSQVNLMTPQELRQVLEEMGLSEETMKQIEVWHGSPHFFDRFSTEFMGSGEGAQAFGWGLYFTDLKGIAKSYAKKLRPVQKYVRKLPKKEIEVKIDNDVDRIFSENMLYSSGIFEKSVLKDKILYNIDRYSTDMDLIDIKRNKSMFVVDGNRATRNNIGYDGLREDLDIVVNYGYSPRTIDNMPKDEQNEVLEAAVRINNFFRNSYEKLLDNFDKYYIEDPQDTVQPEKKLTNLYNVSLHQGKTPEQYTWLDWYEPLSKEMSENIEKKLIEKGIYKGDIGLSFVYQNEDISDILAKTYKKKPRMFHDFYEVLTNELKSDKEASLFLLESGFDGIKYPAESISRGATSDGARGFNYVVFDENAATIQEVVQFQNSVLKDTVFEGERPLGKKVIFDYYDAVEMYKESKSPDEIFEKTNWFPYNNNIKKKLEWRYELKSDISFKKDPKIGVYKLGNLLNYEDLFKTYSQLKDLEVEITDAENYIEKFDDKSQGIYSIDDNKIYLKYHPHRIDISILIHEVQHAIDNIEGLNKYDSGMEMLVDIMRKKILDILFEKEGVDIDETLDKGEEVLKETQVYKEYMKGLNEKEKLAILAQVRFRNKDISITDALNYVNNVTEDYYKFSDKKMLVGNRKVSTEDIRKIGKYIVTNFYDIVDQSQPDNEDYVEMKKFVDTEDSDFAANEILPFDSDITGYELREMLNNTLGKKNTERLLNQVGFDGYVPKLNFQNKLDNVGLKLVPNGFFRPSTREIYLNSENPNILETTIHEFAHPFLQYLRDKKSNHYKAGVKLLQTNKTEAKKYIDFVKQTQPSLKEDSQAFHEEVLAQIVGDNGAKLVNSTKKNSIKEWLKELWETIGKLVGISEYTPDEISRMTLEEFSDSVVAEMMDIKIKQREFIPSQLFEELSELPFITEAQALDLYKNIYTDDLNHWKDSDMNC